MGGIGFIRRVVYASNTVELEKLIPVPYSHGKNDDRRKTSTAALWISYIIDSNDASLFIFAERSRDFDLHLCCVERFITIFHASNHFTYAKSTRRYLDTMRVIMFLEWHILRPDY